MTSDPTSPRDPESRPCGPPDAADARRDSGRHLVRTRRSLWFVFKAIEIRLRFIAILVGIGLVIGYWDTLGNYWDKWTRPTDAGVTMSVDDEFYCPMHPSVVRDKAEENGAVPKCPICGMPLSKRKKGEPLQLPEGVISRVQLSPYRIELAGVKTVELTHRPLTVDIRTVGYVAIDERKQARIVSRASGYVEQLFVNESFANVRANDPLAQIYSPELYSAAQELLIARRGANPQLADIAVEKLRLLGVADQEIDEIIRSGNAGFRLVLRAPRSGHVFEKRVVEGDHVEAGQILFEIADLSTVWIEGEIHEKDIPLAHVGQEVQAVIDAFPGRMFPGRVSLVHPHVQVATRTIRIRFELDNPGHMLRPGMFATVFLKSPVLEMEPFRSQLAAFREQSAATKGAEQVGSPASGEVPPTGDQRSRNEGVSIASQKVCPVTGAKLGSMGKPIRAVANGKTVMLCCPACEDEWAARPDFYQRRLSTVTEEGVLAVPELSVIDTGEQKIVYVEREPGTFEGVAVTLGPLADGYYAVIDGVLPGDRVVAAGAFLVDAETRLNPAAATAYFGASGTPSSTGLDSGPNASRANGAAAGSLPEKARANLAKLPEPDRTLAERQGTCPITDLPLGSMGVPFKLMVDGTPLFLCCERCKDQAGQDPPGMLKKIRDRGDAR